MSKASSELRLLREAVEKLCKEQDLEPLTVAFMPGKNGERDQLYLKAKITAEAVKTADEKYQDKVDSEFDALMSGFDIEISPEEVEEDIAKNVSKLKDWFE